MTLRRWIVRSGLVILAFLVVTLFFSIEPYIYNLIGQKEVSFWPQFRWNLGRWFPWILFTPLILWLRKKLPLRRRRLWARLLANFVAGGVISLAAIGMTQTLNGLLRWYLTHGYPTSFGWMFRQLGDLSLAMYWAILGVGYLADYGRRYRRNELLASRLEAKLAQARLEALRSQVHPHFLFNTLHAISALVHEDPAGADLMIARLSDLLRSSLDQSGVQEVPLRTEMESLGYYLDIMRIRFKDRLAVDLRLDAETLEALVPSFILQPLAENAIRHGLAPREEGGRLEIRSWRQGESLLISVKDDGPGFGPDPESAFRRGFGLSTAAERLDQLYGGGRLKLRNAPGRGAEVVLELPFHPAGRGDRP